MPRDRAHLFIDVVLANALREGRQLAFDIGGVLAGKRRGGDLVATWSVT